MNTGEKTTVATLAVFFGLIFLLIIITICCVLRRGCRQKNKNGEYRRQRMRGASDFDKSGTVTSSDTRLTDGFPSEGLRVKSSPAITTKSGQLQTTALLNISEEEVSTEKGTKNESKYGLENSPNNTKEQTQLSNVENSAILSKAGEYQAEMTIEILQRSPGRHSQFCYPDRGQN